MWFSVIDVGFSIAGEQTFLYSWLAEYSQRMIRSALMRHLFVKRTSASPGPS